MATVAELDVRISAETSSLDRGLSDAVSKIEAAGTRMKSIGSLMSLAITAPLVGIGAAVFSVGREFDEAFDKIIIATGATGQELEGLKQSFRNVVSDVPTSFAKASEAISALAARTNLTGKALEDLTKTELELARMTGGNLSEQIRNTTRLFGDWGVATDQQTATLDKLFRAFQSGGGSIESLTQKLVQFGAPLRQMGFDLDEAIALIAKFEKEGVNMSTVLSSLRIALGRMADAGINDAGEALKILIDRIKKAGDTSEGARIAMQVFGQKAGPDMKAAILEGRFAIEELIDKIKNGQSTIKSAGDQTKDFGERFTELKTKVLLAVEPLGERFFNAVNNLTPLLVRTVSALSSIIEWFTKLPQPVQNATVALLGIAAVAGPIVTAFGQIVSATSGLIGSFSSTLPVIARLGSALGGLPAIAGLAAAGVTAAVIAAEMKWSAAQSRFRAGLETSAKDIDIYGNKIKKMMRFDDPALVEAINKPSKLVNGMIVDLKTGLTQAEPVIRGKATKLGAALPAGFGDGIKSGGGAKKLAEDFVDEFSEELMLQSKEAGEAATFFINDALEQLQDVFTDLPLPIRTFSQALDIATEGIVRNGKAVAEGIGFWRGFANFVDEAQRRIKAANQKVIDDAKQLQDTFEDLSRQLPRSWNTIIDALTGGATKAGVKIKGFAVDVINVFNDMPGKWGDAFRRTISEVDRWVNFIDSAIKLIQRILGSKDPSGLGGIFSNLIKLFQSTTDAIAGTSATIQDQMSGIASVMQYASQQSQDAFNAIGSSATNAASTIQNTAGKFASAATSVIGSIMGIVGGLSLLLGGGGAFGTGTLGKTISGALGGAALGAGLASLANWILGAGVFALGPAGLIGAAIGGLVGLFKGIFGGKSEAQKRAEQQAAQQAEFNAQQSAQTVINAAIEGFDKALRFFDNLDAFTAPRKAKFEAFWTAMNRLMKGFLDLAKNWAGSSLAEAKAFAESVGPIVETVGNAVAAFDALSGYLGVPERAITKFSTDLQLVLEKFIAVMEAFPRERFIKHARTFADRIQSIVSVIGAGVQSFTALKDYQGIASNTFDVFAADLRLAVEKMIGIADSINAGMVKEAQRFSDRVGSVVTVIGTAVASFVALKDYGKIPIAVFDAFFADLLAATNRMAAITTQIDQEMLGQAAQFADKITPISSALKLWAEAAEVIRGYTAIAAEVWDQILADFERGLVLINLLIVDAQLYVEKAQTFRDLIAEGSADIAAALSQYVSSIQSMSSIMTGMPMGGTPVGTMAPTSQAALGASQQSVSLTLNLNGNDPRTQQVIQFIESVFGAGTLSGTSSQFA